MSVNISRKVRMYSACIVLVMSPASQRCPGRLQEAGREFVEYRKGAVKVPMREIGSTST